MAIGNETLTRPEHSKAMMGNQNASKPFRLVSDTLRRIAMQEPHRLRAACEKLFDKAGDDVQAFRELADRIEGKVASNEQQTVRVVLVKDITQLMPIDGQAEVVTDQEHTV